MASLGPNELSHWGRDEIAVISDDIFKCIFFLNENVKISIKISLMFVPKGPIDIILARHNIERDVTMNF